MIGGATRLVGLIGWPVEHSLSPVMQNAAFEALRLDWKYVPLPVVPGTEAESLRALVTLGFAGANVTVPHKSVLVERVDSIAFEAEAVGAVNTIVVRRQPGLAPSLDGHNTDCAGFLCALENNGFDPAGETAVIVGAGGAARAAVFGLLTAGLSKGIVLNRHLARAESLVADLARVGHGTLEAHGLADGTIVEASRDAAILINASPVGMWPHHAASVWPSQAAMPSGLVVCDLVYVPRVTRLLEQARESGCRNVGGLDMLVEQGARSFALWTGAEAPVQTMRRACEKELERRFP